MKGLAWIAAACMGLVLPLGCAAPPAVRSPGDSRGIDHSAAVAANAAGISGGRAARYLDAERMFRQAIALDRTWPAPRNNLGLVLMQRGKWKEAGECFLIAARLDTSSVEPLLNLGHLYERLGWDIEATAYYEQAYGMDADDPEVIGRLARARVRAGRTDDETRAMIARLAADGPAHWTAWARQQALDGGSPPALDGP